MGVICRVDRKDKKKNGENWAAKGSSFVSLFTPRDLFFLHKKSWDQRKVLRRTIKSSYQSRSIYLYSIYIQLYPIYYCISMTKRTGSRRINLWRRNIIPGCYDRVHRSWSCIIWKDSNILNMIQIEPLILKMKNSGKIQRKKVYYLRFFLLGNITIIILKYLGQL